MRILLATDAWHPQVNGVVRTYSRLVEEARAFGAEIIPLSADGRTTFPLPTYPEIRLALVSPASVRDAMMHHAADFIHIATEGTIGIAARTYCRNNGLPFTTSYHTRFPEYLSARLPVPTEAGYAVQRWFHSGGAGMMVATPSLARDLAARGFRRILPWTRGVDLERFHPSRRRLDLGARPVMLYVGRIAVEKNLEEFLSIERPGLKVVVGDGPELARLTSRFTDCRFMGNRTGEELADIYASADVFVFPSRTDTFGVVQLEAMASGLPVAAHPVTGPIDVVADGISGVLDEDLAAAIDRALLLDRARARAHALAFTWQQCARDFLANIVRANRDAGYRPLQPEFEASFAGG